MSLATEEFDLVVEAEAHRVTDPQTVADLAGRWAAEGWPCRVDESGQARTVGRAAAVLRLTPDAPRGNCARDGGAVRRHLVAFLEGFTDRAW